MTARHGATGRGPLHPAGPRHPAGPLQLAGPLHPAGPGRQARTAHQAGPAGSPARRGLAAAAAAAVGLIAVAGCGTSAAVGTAARSPAPAAPPLALSLADAGGTSWAVVEMGASGAQDENFWQVFVRPAGAAAWRLATPAGVADNGGLVVASTGPGALLAGFRPSQDLTFSPLAVTADAGTRWAAAGPVSPGLSDVPGALAAGPGGRLIALTDGGRVELGQRGGTRWARLASVRGLAATAAGRACGLSGVNAAAFSADGTALLGGTCGQPGVAGIFAWRRGAWHAAGPALPSALAGRDVSVLRLASVPAPAAGAAPSSGTRAAPGSGRGTAAGSGPGQEAGSGGSLGNSSARSGRAAAASSTLAVLAVGRGGSTGIVVAWSAGPGTGGWRLSPVLPAGSLRVRSASLWPDGSAGLVLSGRHGARGVTIAGPGRSWTGLPALPAGVATLAPAAGGGVEALAVDRSTVRAWRLNGAVAGWSQFQQVRVPVPYGSSS
jgi:hypothetical protein